MKPGEDIIYKCPKCGNLLKGKTFISGNTFGAISYSDGKMIAPMLPELPDLTKCKRCDNIFWLSELAEIGKCWSSDDSNPKWANAEYAGFLNIKDLYRALELVKIREEKNNRLWIRRLIKSEKKREKEIRIRIWWAFNDRVRNGKQETFVEEDKILWEENCRDLLNLLNNKSIKDDIKLIVAELFRNLGEFKDCIETINSIKNEDLNWIKDQIKHQAEQQDTFVFVCSQTG